jgi:hypothetical protein
MNPYPLWPTSLCLAELKDAQQPKWYPETQIAESNGASRVEAHGLDEIHRWFTTRPRHGTSGVGTTLWLDETWNGFIMSFRFPCCLKCPATKTMIVTVYLTWTWVELFHPLNSSWINELNNQAGRRISPPSKQSRQSLIGTITYS